MLFSSLSGVGKLHDFTSIYTLLFYQQSEGQNTCSVFFFLRLYMQAYIYTGFDEYSQIL